MLEGIGMKRLLAFSILVMALIPVLACLFIGNLFFTRGLDCIMGYDLEQAIKRSLEPPSERPGGIQTATSYKAIPDNVKKHFEYPLRENFLYEHDTFMDGGNENYTIFLLHRNIGGNSRYAWQRIPESDEELLIWPTHLELIYALVIVNALIVLFIWIGTRLLLRRLSRPSRALAEWAAKLSQRDLNAPTPDFSYPELNHIAGMLKANLRKEYSIIEKEEEFLKYCSHELRNPVTTIKVSTQLLLKQMRSEIRDAERELATLNRIAKSTDTIANLVVTLLWLSRKKALEPAFENVDLAELVRGIADSAIRTHNAAYGTDCEILCELSGFNLDVPVEATRVILENLIRNALRFSPDGKVRILQEGPEIEIRNMVRAGDCVCEDGFGLGLELVERLVKKLGWQCHWEFEGEVYRAILVLEKNEVFVEPFC